MPPRSRTAFFPFFSQRYCLTSTFPLSHSVAIVCLRLARSNARRPSLVILTLWPETCPCFPCPPLPPPVLLKRGPENFFAAAFVKRSDSVYPVATRPIKSQARVSFPRVPHLIDPSPLSPIYQGLSQDKEDLSSSVFDVPLLVRISGFPYLFFSSFLFVSALSPPNPPWKAFNFLLICQNFPHHPGSLSFSIFLRDTVNFSATSSFPRDLLISWLLVEFPSLASIRNPVPRNIESHHK